MNSMKDEGLRLNRLCYSALRSARNQKLRSIDSQDTFYQSYKYNQHFRRRIGKTTQPELLA